MIEKLKDKFRNSSTIEKISVLLWILTLVSIIIFVIFTVSFDSTTQKYGYILALSAIVTTVLLFSALMTTVFPKFIEKRREEKNNELSD